MKTLYPLLWRRHFLVGLLAAPVLLVVSVTGIVMWWRRRKPGKLGPPHLPVERRRRPGRRCWHWASCCPPSGYCLCARSWSALCGTR